MALAPPYYPGIPVRYDTDIREKVPTEKLVSERLMDGQLPPDYADLEAGPTGGRLTPPNFAGISRADLDRDLSLEDPRLMSKGTGVLPAKTDKEPRTNYPYNKALDTAEDFVAEEIVSPKVRKEVSTSKNGTKEIFSKDNTNTDVIGTSENVVTTILNKKATPEEKDNSIQSFMDEFVKNAPQYQGKTRFEKGMDGVMLGFTIALKGAQNENGIKAISEAWTEVGDRFAEDAKEKRKYQQAINLAGFKYGVAQTDELAKEGRAEERLVYTGDKPFEYGGRTYNKGDNIVITRADRKSGTLPIEKMILSSEYLALAKEKLALRKAQVTQEREALDKLIIDSEDSSTFLKDSKMYTDALVNLETQASVHTMLNGMKKAVQANQVTGAVPFIGKKIAGVYNFLGAKIPEPGKGEGKINIASIVKGDKKKNVDSLTLENEEKAILYNSLDTDGDGVLSTEEKRAAVEYGQTKGIEEISTLDKLAGLGVTANRYNDQAQYVANLMIKEILGEGSKNVSNIDRTLANEIVGLLTNYNALTANPDLLVERINRIQERAENGYMASLNEVQSIENLYANKYYSTGQQVLGQFSPLRERSFERIRERQTPQSDIAAQINEAKEETMEQLRPRNFTDFVDIQRNDAGDIISISKRQG